MDDSVEAVDAALIARLRHAIAGEEDDHEKQLGGVLRMLGAAIPDHKQRLLFGTSLPRVRSRLAEPERE